MAIRDRDRKVLWARAGNKCAMCRHELVQVPAQAGRNPYVFGEECHILSAQDRGPRAAVNTALDLDAYDNLILLCPTDHSRVDQNPADWPAERLLVTKLDHERWVAENLADRLAPVRVSRTIPSALHEITDAEDLMATVAGAEEYGFQHDELLTQSEADEVGAFLQNLQDYAEMWDEFEAGYRTQATFDMSRQLRDLRGEGWRVFGAKTRGTISGGAAMSPAPWEVAFVRVVRADRPAITAIDQDGAAARRSKATGQPKSTR